MAYSNLFFTNACTEADSTNSKMKLTYSSIQVNKLINIISFNVPARSWEIISPNFRKVRVPVKEINLDVLKHGFIKVYMAEGDKMMLLPFNYYQLRRMTLVETNCMLGEVWVTITGDFIVNVSSGLDFKVIVIGPKAPAIFKSMPWSDYNYVKNILNL